MKSTIFYLGGVLVITAMMMGGCVVPKSHDHAQGSQSTRDTEASFVHKNEGTFNPVTNQYEKQPPYGPRSNKSS